LNDPLLTQYIEQAACYNNTLLIAKTTILEAMALRQMVASQLFPQLGMSFTSSRTYFSKNGPVFATGVDQTSSVPGFPFELQVPQIQNIFTALLNASWTIDLFGKVRREIEAVDALIGSAIDNKNDVLLTIIAEVAQNYIALRNAQQQGVLVEESITLLEEELQIAQTRFTKGLTNVLTVELVEAQLSDLKSTLPTICSQIYQYIYALSVLTGSTPETLLCDLLPIRPLPCPPCGIACGLRSDLLRRRPDVRFAERLLAAATANIGVSIASFFPSISLSGNIGFQSIHLHNLFQAGSKTWSIGEVVQMPLFQGGRLIGNLHLSEALAMTAGYRYQQAVLTALQEVEGALVAYVQDEKRESYLRHSVESYELYTSHVQDRFAKGLVGATEVIESRRELNTAQQNHLASMTSLVEGFITLYKALGGGWEELQL
jgi:NodT family efflux transporter outer membrane factor (OMF) lipoprotein